MKEIYYIGLAIISFILIGCGGGGTTTEAVNNEKTISGKVIGISDGDTITVLDADKVQYKIRLSCIDTPEKGQDFGTRAKEVLSSMIWNRQVNVQYSKTDQYGRLIGTVSMGSLLVNYEQVKQGMAWAYRKYCQDCKYYDAEKYARNNMIGIWSKPNPIPPWEWRKDSVGSKNIDWSYLYNDTCTIPTTSNGGDEGSSGNTCGSKKYCNQMNSCDEAYFYYQSCGLDRLDGDKDGVPCESLCG